MPGWGYPYAMCGVPRWMELREVAVTRMSEREVFFMLSLPESGLPGFFGAPDFFVVTTGLA